MSKQVGESGSQKVRKKESRKGSALRQRTLPTCLLTYHLRAVVDVATLARGRGRRLLPAHGILEHLVRVRVRVRFRVQG